MVGPIRVAFWKGGLFGTAGLRGRIGRAGVLGVLGVGGMVVRFRWLFGLCEGFLGVTIGLGSLP